MAYLPWRAFTSLPRNDKLSPREGFEVHETSLSEHTIVCHALDPLSKRSLTLLPFAFRVQNVYELAMTIAGRCFGTFDRHRKSTEYRFFDMFESSIGAAMDGEATLFQDFSHASRQASTWLQSHQRLEARTRTPSFFDKLLDVGLETDLLSEIKDIRDELDIIKMVLDHQHYLLPELRDAIRTIYRDERSHAALRKVEKGFDEQEKNITNPLKDLARMDSQAGRIYESIRDLLDLKQKHANAFEARYAREQATGTQRQGQTIMVFTIGKHAPC